MVTKLNMTSEKAPPKAVLHVFKADRVWFAKLTDTNGREYINNFGALSPTVAALLYFARNCDVSEIEWRIGDDQTSSR